MMSVVSQAVRKVIPYKILSAARLTQLRLADSKDYHERIDRRVFFYRAFCLLYKNSISGDYAEFGCNGGMTFVLAYYNSQMFRHPRFSRKQWAFDSFQGLPPQKEAKDEHPCWVEGLMKTTEDEFRTICSGSGVPASAYTTVPGFYEDTIGRYAKNPPERLPNDIALAYIDCDLYSSTKSVLEFLQPRMKHGMIIALDDYYCYSTTAAAGERVALMEFMGSVADRFYLVPFVQYGYAGMSFIVEDRKFLSFDPSVGVAH